MSESILIHITELPLNLEQVPDDEIPCLVRMQPNETWFACKLSEIDSLVTNPASAEPSVSVFIPGLHVLSAQVQAPRKQHKHLARILPFLCEEKLACDIESVHITAGSPSGEQIPVRIIQRSLLEEVIQRLRQLGLPPTAIFADSDPLLSLLPQGGQLLWVDNERCLAVANHHSQPSLYCTSPQQTPAVLRTFATSGELRAYRQPLTDAPLNSEITLGLEELSSQGVQLQVVSLPGRDQAGDRPHDSWLATLERIPTTGTDYATLTATDLEQLPASCINLLSGAYTPDRVKQSGFRWQPIALAASLLLGLNLLYLLASGYYFNVRSEQLRSDSETLYHEYFPQDRRIINIRTQTQNHLSQGAGNRHSGFLTALGEFYTGWKTHSQNLTLKSIRYNQNRQEMLLDIESNTIEQLDQLRRTLGERAEMLSANESKTNGSRSGVKGHLKFSPNSTGNF